MRKFLVLALVVLLCIVKVKANNDDDDYNYDDDDDSKPRSQLTRKQIIALTRDWLARENPDEIYGYSFFPVWAVVMFSISAFFFVLMVLSGFAYLLGCKNKKPDAAHINQSKQRLDSVGASKIGLHK